MYKMKADGVVFYDPSSDDMTLHVLSPKAKYDLEKAASLEFTMLPGNVMYDGLQKLKTIITLEQDGEEIFRGRVVETATNTYNQKEVYCVGELSYLRDSLVRPYEFAGKAIDLFRQLVEKHNEQVDEFKRFEVGIITAITDEDETETESEAYADTLSEIRQMLVSPFGGYLRVRWADGVRYLDYIKEYDDECGQAIEFGVNLVDIEKKLDAQDMFTVLVPLGGYDSGSKDPVTVESVNDGKDYLEDAEAIAQYGRIVKTYKWEDITDPQEIMDKGLEHFEKMKAKRTLTIKAVDLHIIDASVDSIRLGKKVRLVSSPHGLNEPDICSAINLDIEKPENSEYTFGIPQETLTDKNAARNKKYDTNMNHVHRWLTETNNSFEVFVNEVNGQILLMADNITAQGKEIELKASQESVDALGTRLTTAELDIDGLEGQIALLATKEEVNAFSTTLSTVQADLDAAEAAIELKASKSDLATMDNRVTQAEVGIDGAKADIALKASQADLDALDARVSQAEIDIDGANAAISLKASITDVQGLETRVSSAELRIDGMDSTITAQAKTIAAKADTVRVEALETEITGLLKVEELAAEIADLDDVAVTQLSVSGTAHCTNLEVHGAGTVDGDLNVTGGLTVGGETLESATLTMGEVSETIFSPADIDLSHSHKIIDNGDGTFTLGEVATEGGSFNIADTKTYKDGVSAAKDSVTLTSMGWQGSTNVVSASNGKSLTVELPDFSVTGGDSFASNKTTVYFSTPSVNGPLASKVVDASGVYTNGYNVGKADVTLTAAGWVGSSNVVSASNGESLTVSLPGFSTSGGDSFSDNKTTVYFHTGSVTGPLASKEVDATSVYNDGYADATPASVSRVATYDSSGNAYNVTVVVKAADGTTKSFDLVSIDASAAYEAGYAAGQEAAGSGYDEGYAAGYEAAKANVTVSGYISSITNTQPNYMYAQGSAFASIDGEQVSATSFNKSQYFPNLGQ